MLSSIAAMGLSRQLELRLFDANEERLDLMVRLAEQGHLKCGVEQVLNELKSYQWDDTNIVQDSVMALAIAATQIEGETTIAGAEAAGITYPGFADDLAALGGGVSQVRASEVGGAAQ